MDPEDLSVVAFVYVSVYQLALICTTSTATVYTRQRTPHEDRESSGMTGCLKWSQSGREPIVSQKYLARYPLLPQFDSYYAIVTYDRDALWRVAATLSCRLSTDLFLCPGCRQLTPLSGFMHEYDFKTSIKGRFQKDAIVIRKFWNITPIRTHNLREDSGERRPWSRVQVV
ncbi:hypothetical protein EDD18DRAFT_1436422 [Armillaria luteobubalina]|uniref:Uncharacterized protein n=1 Tax=Armillaria luteobubalina TaxID=153913 RepID=A0AA39UJ91_9AGAR|nr:hypothetical protein EDD18DRAFT_1436422 [Armillaria luteobubalina]